MIKQKKLEEITAGGYPPLYADMARELLELRKALTLRSMDDAPKDEPILLFSPHAPHWFVGEFNEASDACDEYWGPAPRPGFSWHGYNIEPTGWLPLPVPLTEERA